MQYGVEDASYQAAAGFEGLQQLVNDFYDIMCELPEAAKIRAMHPADLTVSKDKLARFLAGWLGGPRLYRETYGPIAIPAAHSHLNIGAEERDAWLLCMQHALAKAPYTTEFKNYLLSALAVPAERCRNS